MLDEDDDDELEVVKADLELERAVDESGVDDVAAGDRATVQVCTIHIAIIAMRSFRESIFMSFDDAFVVVGGIAELPLPFTLLLLSEPMSLAMLQKYRYVVRPREWTAMKEWQQAGGYYGMAYGLFGHLRVEILRQGWCTTF